MNDLGEIEAILDRFRGWLETAHAEAQRLEEPGSGLGSAAGAPAREFGIIDLVEEFTALRHELKLQTKSGRGLIEQTENTTAALRQAIDQFRSIEPREAQAAWTAGKGLAEALADLDEALARGEREIDRARRQIADESVRGLETSIIGLFKGQPWIPTTAVACRITTRSSRHSAARARRVRKCSDVFLEGYGLIQKRLRRAMASEQVVHIACEGKPVDPELMTVLELVEEPGKKPGTVARELRRGYMWRGRVIRFAEVQAVRGAYATAVDTEGAAACESETDVVDTTAESAEELETAGDSTSGPS